MSLLRRPRAARAISLAACLVLIGSLAPTTQGPFSARPAAAGHTPIPASVNLPGSLESEATAGACADWDPACPASAFSAQPNSVYIFQSAEIPAGSWEYKVAMGGWAENYGSNFQQDGPNIGLTLASARTVRFYYDHKTHYIADNVRNTIYTVPGSYGPAIGCPEWSPDCLGSLMSDTDGDGVFTFVTDDIDSGTYHFKVTANESWDINWGAGGAPGGTDIAFTVPADSGYTVTFSFDVATHTPSVVVASDLPSQDGNVEYLGLGHDSQSDVYRQPFGAVTPGTTVKLRFRTFHDDVSGVRARVYDDVRRGESILRMTRVAQDVPCYDPALDERAGCDYWQTTVTPARLTTLYYRFIVSDGSATAYYADDNFRDGGWGVATPGAVDNSYVITVADAGFETIPWLRDAVVYQIFPDRFRNGRPANDPSGLEPRYGYPPSPLDRIERRSWAQLPEGYCRKYVSPADPCTEQPRGRDYFGGDLKGVDQRLNYLQALGVTAIYFNPIFDAASNHSYDTQDYTRIDPFFGTQRDWNDLVKHARHRGIRIILDGVFNHVSSDSPYFDRYGHYPGLIGACESTSSPYREWFYFRPLVGGPCAGPTGPRTMTYEAWFGFDSLPVLDKTEEAVQDLVYDAPGNITEKWLDAGAAGWRLDVMGDGSFPAEFWREFRAVVKDGRPNAPVVGELWKKDEVLPRIRGDIADTVQNYRFRNAILGFFGEVDDKGFVDDFQSDQPPSLFARKLMSIREDYPDAAYFQMLNIMDSHDTKRILWSLTPGANNREAREFDAANLARGKQRLRLAVLAQMTLPGTPTIYYGDEIALTGDDDPDDRRTFPWDSETGLYGSGGDQSQLAWYRKLITLRRQNAVLRTGGLDFLLTDDEARTLAYSRRAGGQLAIVALNRAEDGARTLEIPLAGVLRDGVTFTDRLTGAHYTSADGALTLALPALGGALLVADAGQDLAGPAAPTGLAAAAGNGFVDLSWSAVGGAASYTVYRSPLSGGGYEAIGMTGGTSLHDATVENGTRYFYVVRALDALGNEGAASNEAAATPFFPVGYAVLQWPHSITTTLSVDPTETIYGRVYVAGLTDAGGDPSRILAAVGFGPDGSAPTEASWSWFPMARNACGDCGNNYEYNGRLEPESAGSYDYLVRFSTDGGLTWAYGDIDGYVPPDEPGTDTPGALTVNEPSDTTPPDVPTDLRIDDWSASFIRLAWDGVADAARYRVYRRTADTAYSGTPYAIVDGSVTTFTDEEVATGETYFYVVRAMDASRNESAASNEVSQTAEPKLVAVTFRVRVPASTPPSDIVYLPGNIDQLGPWNPGKQAMTDAGGGIWEATVEILDGTALEYKYTRGTWDRVEWWGSIVSTANRFATISYGTDGTQLIDDTSTAWDDTTIPDGDKAVRYWRDPLVVSTSPAAGSSGAAPGSITVTFERDIQPLAGEDYSSSVVAERSGSAVAGSTVETSAGVLTWTPAAPLVAGSYQVTVYDLRSDLGGDSVPMQAPYVFTFTVT
jgi:glycosidase